MPEKILRHVHLLEDTADRLVIPAQAEIHIMNFFAPLSLGTTGNQLYEVPLIVGRGWISPREKYIYALRALQQRMKNK